MTVGGADNPVRPVLSVSDEAARETSRAAFMSFIITIEVPGISHKMRKHEGAGLMSFDELGHFVLAFTSPPPPEATTAVAPAAVC